MTIAKGHLSPYLSLSREQWSQLRAAVPLSLTEADLIQLRDQFNLPDVLGGGRPAWVQWVEQNPVTDEATAETAE